jgi:hypothetical protein
MEINLKVPFYPNLPDGTHSYQSCLKMILKYFLPEEEYSYKELDKVTAKKEDLWTWPLAGMVWMQSKGFIVKYFELFDYERFANEGLSYMVEFGGEEYTNEQDRHCDLKYERRMARKLLNIVKQEKKISTLEDLRQLIRDNYLLILNINSRRLYRSHGYLGHFVLVKGFDDQGHFLLHDPGLLAVCDKTVDSELLEAAWAYPDETFKNIMAFKLENKPSESVK